MEVIKTEDFLKTFRKLPKEIQGICLIQEERLKENWRDPRLHIKPIKKLPNALRLELPGAIAHFSISAMTQRRYFLI